MILGFKTRVNGKPTGFIEKIKAGSKIHTLREDPNHRWRSGMPIEFATGVRTKNYNQFMRGECKAIQIVQLNNHGIFILSVDGKIIRGNELLAFAQNDGFDTLEDFQSWFNPLIDQHKAAHHAPLRLRLIHWTAKQY